MVLPLTTNLISEVLSAANETVGNVNIKEMARSMIKALFILILSIFYPPAIKQIGFTAAK